MKPVARSMNVLKGLIFSSRWLQAPLYLGLIIAQAVYVYHFGYELFHLFHVKPTEKQCLEVPGRADRIQKLVRQNRQLREENQTLRKQTGSKISTPAPVSTPAAGPKTANPAVIAKTATQCPRPDEQVWVSAETMVMLLVLTLIDVVMIANLLIMVIIGGYETFVSRLQLQTHPDKPEWLSQVNASVLKVKLAMALIGISSIHLLRTFILVPYYEYDTVFWHVIIHLTFLISAIAMAMTDRIMHPPHAHAHAPSKHE